VGWGAFSVLSILAHSECARYDLTRRGGCGVVPFRASGRSANGGRRLRGVRRREGGERARTVRHPEEWGALVENRPIFLGICP